MTDPALRTMFDGPGQALHDAIERDMTEAPDPVSRRERVHRTIDAWLAAAEAAPLDAPSGGSPYVTRLTNSLSYHVAAEAAPLDVERHGDAIMALLRLALMSGDHNKTFTPTEVAIFVNGIVQQVAREYAALRSPDTEEKP